MSNSSLKAARCFVFCGQRADTSCEGRAAAGCFSSGSSSDLSGPVITSYTPQSDLLLACQSQQGVPARRSKCSSAALCRCWPASGTALTSASAKKYRAACCLHCTCVSMFVQRYFFFLSSDGSTKAINTGFVTGFVHARHVISG